MGDQFEYRQDGFATEGSDESSFRQAVLEQLSHIDESVGYLNDLFVRRLQADKQKNKLIDTLSQAATYAFVEPFLQDLILLLDRLDTSEDEFALSVREELYGILNRRGVEQIAVSRTFDPALQKAVRVIESPDVESLQVTGIVRNGYTLAGKVIRAAEVIVSKPIEREARQDADQLL